MSKTAIIIPARYGSTRLPGKPLLEINGKSIIQWVFEKASQSKLADMVIIATDDERIASTVKGFGGQVAMTASFHQSGSDRIAEVLKNNPNIEIAVNVQGDEPLIKPESIDLAIETLKQDDKADISTLIRVIEEDSELENPNVVKAVIDKFGFAMYFSRSKIPYQRDIGHSKFFGHVGLYAYSRKSLLSMTALEQTNLEKTECLEQLRALQHGMKIKTAIVNYKPIGIDTQEDLEEFQNLLKNC